MQWIVWGTIGLFLADPPLNFSPMAYTIANAAPLPPLLLPLTSRLHSFYPRHTPYPWPLRRVVNMGKKSTMLPCKAKRQYLLTLQVSRHCILAVQSRVCVLAFQQTQDFELALVYCWSMSQMLGQH